MSICRATSLGGGGPSPPAGRGQGTRHEHGTAIATALLVLAIPLLAPPAPAHKLAGQSVRELVRIQGYRSPAPSSVPVVRELTLAVLGRQLPFAAVEWRVFSLAEAGGESEPTAPAALALQGERTLLRRIATARTDQRLTLLAERRPGSSDLFLLAVDLCPP